MSGFSRSNFVRVTVALLALATSHTGLAQEHDKAMTIQVEAQPLATALQEFSEQSGLQVAYVATLAQDVSSKGARDAATPVDALVQILDDTGLKYQFVNDDTVAIGPAAAADKGGDSDPGNAPEKPTPILMAQDQTSTTTNRRNEATVDETSSQKEAKKLLEEITVVGTRIRGAQPSSPVVTITQEEMRLSGQNNLGEAIRALPQNFNGGQNPEIAPGSTAGGLSNQNITGGSSLNLRGLGPDATLTLLNGARLPYDGLFQATDISAIPIAAVERVEVLLDGASAIYGSDAVGGVANIILRRDFEGVELSARYGTATDGGHDQQQYAGVVGHVWGAGSFLITGDYSDTRPVRARQRSYLSNLPIQDVTIFPGLTQSGGLFSGHQNLGDITEIMIDAFVTERRQRAVEQTSSATFDENARETNVWGISSSLSFALPKEWSLRLHGFVGQDESESHFIRYSISSGMQTQEGRSCSCNQANAAGLDAEGPIFALPGGDARLSIGGGYRKNEFQQLNLLTATTATDGEARNKYIYGEFNLPLVSEDQELPLARRLLVNGAIRYENHDTFGDTTTPKIGATWSVVPGFDIKASWGRSFKVPTLLQQFQDTALPLFPASLFSAGTVPSGGTVFLPQGGNPNLDPERAEVVTAGFIAQPDVVPGLRVEIGWFDIDYEDRVAAPITTLAQVFDPAFAEFLTLNPSAEQQSMLIAAADSFNNFTGEPYDPADVYAIFQATFVNTVHQQIRGLDVAASYSTDVMGGGLTASLNANRIIDSTRKTTSHTPELPGAGIAFFPPRFRGRFGAHWSRDGFTLATYLNYIDGVTNIYVVPEENVTSMTTLDLTLDYRLDTGPLNGFGVTVAATNIFNEEPPFMQNTSSIRSNYDSTNYSALGRVVSVTARKRF